MSKSCKYCNKKLNKNNKKENCYVCGKIKGNLTDERFTKWIEGVYKTSIIKSKV